jgi:hypothetical protein
MAGVIYMRRLWKTKPIASSRSIKVEWNIARELYDIAKCGFFQRVAHSRSIYWVQTFASEKPRERALFWGFSTCTRRSVISAGSITQIQSADIIKKKVYKAIF